LKIQNSRHGDRFTLDNKIPRKFLNCRVLKLTLQPFAENAIIHGFNGNRDKGKITLSAYESGGALTVEISNDGAVMEKERAEWLDKRLSDWREICEKMDGKNIGLLNVQTRIKLFFGEGCGVSFRSTPEETVFSVKLPYEVDKDV
jgi:two-component system sensor histidine kinase YesM